MPQNILIICQFVFSKLLGELIQIHVSIWRQWATMSSLHYSDVMMRTMRLKSLASQLFIQSFVQAQTKENSKAPGHWPLWGEFTGDRKSWEAGII